MDFLHQSGYKYIERNTWFVFFLSLIAVFRLLNPIVLVGSLAGRLTFWSTGTIGRDKLSYGGSKAAYKMLGN
jgi:hypothetical protein